MAYIVFDMEWNQPLDPNSPLAIRLCTRLPLEILQIGAINLETDQRFKVTCCLQQYRILSPRISRLTVINRQEVKQCVPFQQASEQFRRFCGDNPILLTWGFNDITVLRQNLKFYGLKSSWTKRCYNLQIPFHQQCTPDELLMSLKKAMDFLQMEEDEHFHDGLADAVYTAQVAKRLDLERGMQEYPEYLKHFTGDGDAAWLDCLRYANYNRFEDVKTMLKDPRIAQTKCPYCGKLTKAKQQVHPGDNRVLWICRCPEHGEFLVRVSYKGNRDKSVRGSKALFIFNEENQQQYQKAAEKAKAAAQQRAEYLKAKKAQNSQERQNPDSI